MGNPEAGEHHRMRSRLAPAVTLVSGALAGLVVVLLAGTAVAQEGQSRIEPTLEATHLPPLLTVAGERVELRYDAVCVVPDAFADAPCAVDGTAFVRVGDHGPFAALPLRDEGSSAAGRLVAAVPEIIARARTGFSYYAVLRSPANGVSATIPAAGATAPQHSYPLARPVEVDLGAHVFGQARDATTRVAEAAWGTGASEMRLEQGRGLPAIGGASFDVGSDGTVHVLDEANRRLLRWARDDGGPQSRSLAINGTLADLSVAEDGTVYVLESTARDGGSPLLRSFDADGVALSAVEMAEPSSQVRIGPDGPVVLQSTAAQWRRAGDGPGLLGPAAQRVLGRPGRPLRGGGEVVILRRGGELRVALLGAAGVRRAWRVTSETPLAEVELAEPFRDGLVVVVRAYSETKDEFVVLRLGERGMLDSFALSSSDWAETAPLSRFRLAGSSLYQLGSTPSGVFVDRFDLEVR